jgi:hypothetical protein
MTCPPSPASHWRGLGLFHPVFGLGEGSRLLPAPELIEAITTKDAADRFVGGSVDRKAKTLMLLRGDITAIVAPFSFNHGKRGRTRKWKSCPAPKNRMPYAGPFSMLIELS